MTTRFYAPMPYRVRAEQFLHLAVMEKAGIPAVKAYGLLKVPRAYQVRLDNTRKMLARGIDPAQAGQRNGLFTPLEASLLKAAVAAGCLDPTYRRLGDHYATKVLQIQQIRSRMAMPVLVLTAALFIQPLPALISGAISGGAYFMQILSVLLCLAGIVLLAKQLSFWLQRGEPSAARNGICGVLTELPLFGAMHVRRKARDFFESLALLLEAGVQMFDALPIAVESIDNPIMQPAFASILTKMQSGASLPQALAGVAYLNHDSLISFVETGDVSGTVPEMLWRHVNTETIVINHFQLQCVVWFPRIFYGVVMAWMAYKILNSGGISPRLPADV